MQIALIMPTFSQYEVLHYFTIQLCEALKKQGHKTHLLTFEKEKPLEFFEKFKQSSCDFSLTFNLLLPDDRGNFLSDKLKIPHFSWLVDSPNTLFNEIQDYTVLEKSQYQWLGCVDRDFAQLLNQMGFSKTLFLPHAANNFSAEEHENDRPLDVVAFESFIDYERLQLTWQKDAEQWIPLFEEAITLSLKDPTHSYLYHYAKFLNLKDDAGGICKEIVKHGLPLSFLERYLRGLDRVNLIKSIKHKMVDVYGSSDHGFGWKECLKDKNNLRVHSPLPFIETFEVMKKAKIVLNSGSWIRNGGHERIFYAMALGALVITTRTPYLEENFVEGKEIVFYDLNDWEKIDNFVEFYLANEEIRKSIAIAGQEKVLKYHTWEKRAESLIQFASNNL